MKTLHIIYNQKTGNILDIDSIPEAVLAKISSHYFHKKRNTTLSAKRRQEIAIIYEYFCHVSSDAICVEN